MPDRSTDPGASQDGLFRDFSFSDRELEALKSAALGLTERGIGHKLGISWRTVKQHLYAARQRCGARNTTHAVVMAIASGQLDASTILQEEISEDQED